MAQWRNGAMVPSPLVHPAFVHSHTGALTHACVSAFTHQRTGALTHWRKLAQSNMRTRALATPVLGRAAIQE